MYFKEEKKTHFKKFNSIFVIKTNKSNPLDFYFKRTIFEQETCSSIQLKYNRIQLKWVWMPTIDRMGKYSLNTVQCASTWNKRKRSKLNFESHLIIFFRLLHCLIYLKCHTISCFFFIDTKASKSTAGNNVKHSLRVTGIEKRRKILWEKLLLWFKYFHSSSF